MHILVPGKPLFITSGQLVEIQDTLHRYYQSRTHHCLGIGGRLFHVGRYCEELENIRGQMVGEFIVIHVRSTVVVSSLPKGSKPQVSRAKVNYYHCHDERPT